MPVYASLVGFFSQQLTRSIAGLILLGVMVLPLHGCADNEGGGGPVISSLSHPAEDPMSAEEGGDESSVDPNTPNLSADENQAADSPADQAEDVETFAEIAEPSEEENPEISVTPTPTGVTAQLTWDASTDPDVSGYYVYYGKQSSGEPGSCSYEESRAVEAPPATITDLEPNAVYFFAISAFGEAESPCSNEVLVATPPAQS